MNNNIYEEKKRFNALDVLIIIALLILVVVIIFRAQIISLFTDSGSKETCEISFVCESVSNDVYESIKSDSDVIWLSADKQLGTMIIDQGSTEKARIYDKDEKGKWSLTLSDENTRFTGKISATLITDNGYYVDGTSFIAPGMTITISTELAQFDILITDITTTNG